MSLYSPTVYYRVTKIKIIEQNDYNKFKHIYYTYFNKLYFFINLSFYISVLADILNKKPFLMTFSNFISLLAFIYFRGYLIFGDRGMPVLESALKDTCN